MQFLKNKYWLEFLKIILFGLLALSLRKIKFYIPGIESVVSDLSEIALLISLFYITRWWAIIPICIIATIEAVSHNSYSSALIIHIGALLIVYYLVSYLNKKNIKRAIAILVWIGVVVFYYLGMLLPAMILSNSYTGLTGEGNMFENYLMVAHHIQFELLATVTVTTLYFLNIRITRDLEEKNLELEKAVAKAGEADQLKTAFLQNMSHEIRTPLNSIMGFSHLMEPCQNGNPDQVKYIKHIMGGCNQLLNIVNDVVDVSQIATQQTKLTLSERQFSEFIAEVLEIFKTKLLDKAIEIETRIDFEVNTKFVTDQYKLIRVLYHLTDNAIKHCNHKNVVIKAERNSTELTLSVIDYGLGIAPEHQAIIYDSFRQIDSGLNRKTQGNGLGLTIVKGFVNELGGTVTLKSVPGSETVFSVNLPNVFKSVS